MRERERERYERCVVVGVACHARLTEEEDEKRAHLCSVYPLYHYPSHVTLSHTSLSFSSLFLIPKCPSLIHTTLFSPPYNLPTQPNLYSPSSSSSSSLVVPLPSPTPPQCPRKSAKRGSRGRTM